MLRSLTLTNWKSFGEERNTLELSPLTLLVGPNASGKSNALDGLRFLQGVALDYPLGEVLRGRWEGQREIWPPIRGQLVEAARGARTAFELATTWSDQLTHRIAVDTSQDALLAAESVSAGHATNELDTHGASLGGSAGRDSGGAIKVALRAKGSGKSEVRTHSATRSLLGQVTDGGRADPAAIQRARQIRASLRAITFLDIQPSRMRDYRPEHASVLGTSGENISSRLRALAEPQLADVVDWLGELCAPSLTSISFDTTQLREVMFFLDEGPDCKVSARSVSDGTLRFLGLVTALLTATPESLIVLEEPDVGLHPARIHLLARLLEQVTSSGGVQVLATTHSPTLLAHLSPASLAQVVALGRDAEGNTVCGQLGKLRHFSTLRESKQLDHLVSTGWIERAL